ncbi:MAG: Fe-S cluster assembly protein SufD [Acidobacteriia bacterium]|nr:Fe-S cluster assembly protein SufD [Terriglobia bacterium]
MTAVAEQTGAWLAEFTAQKPAEPWLQELRNAAFQRFAELGFPTTKNEEWRFTNVAPIARTTFRVSAAGFAARFRGAEKIEAGGKCFDAARLAAEPNAFVALNAAFTDRPCVLRVPRGAVVEEPIEITYEIAAAGDRPAAVHPRILIVVEANAQCAIVERYSGEGRYLTNAVTEIVAGEGAVVDHYRVQQESREAYHISTLRATLGRSANFSSHSIALGGALVRNDANATLSEGSDATLNGLYIVNGKQHIDNHTEIDHAKPHGTSHEVYKGILDGQATAVFNGRIIVRKDAQKTDSKQTNKNLVLSDEAVIDTKPELQILADDVRCTHGATIGQLDEEALFYLQSRGIGKGEARSLLTYAFAQDILDRIKVPALKDQLEKALTEKLHEHGK